MPACIVFVCALGFQGVMMRSMLMEGWCGCGPVAPMAVRNTGIISMTIRVIKGTISPMPRSTRLAERLRMRRRMLRMIPIRLMRING